MCFNTGATSANARLSRVQGAEAAGGDVEDAAVLASVDVFAG